MHTAVMNNETGAEKKSCHIESEIQNLDGDRSELIGQTECHNTRSKIQIGQLGTRGRRNLFVLAAAGHRRSPIQILARMFRNCIDIVAIGAKCERQGNARLDLQNLFFLGR